MFLQETGRQVASKEPLSAVAVYDGTVWIGSSTGLYSLQGDNLAPVSEHRAPIDRLVATDDALWEISRHGLRRLRNGEWQTLTAQPVVDVVEHRGSSLVAGDRDLWLVKGTQLEAFGKEPSPFPIRRIVAHCESLYALGSGRLALVEASRIGTRNVYDWTADGAWDWGQLPSTVTRDALSSGAALWIATDRGLGLLRGMALSSVRGIDGLCYEDTTCLARGFANDLWIGTTQGAIRKIGDRFHYFAGRRWLPHDQVTAIAVGERKAYFATPAGLGIIEFQPTTLSAKADYYQAYLERWGQKRLGFVHKLEWDDAAGEFVREVSDNDGGYSGNYLAAQSYRYAVTKEPEARREAVNTFHALRWLEAITGIPGFPARSVWARGEKGHQAMHGSGGPHAEWHATPDGRFEWKGDTSSDEICSHFYSVILFLEHVAQGDEVFQAKALLRRIALHLIDHGWKLVDLDGAPTRWGRWDPEYFMTDEGKYDRGLQCLQMLSFIKTATALTDDSKVHSAYQELIRLGYPAHTVRQRNTFPPEAVLHFLDELGLWSYANLLKYETDPDLRSTYRRSLERSWELVRIEQNPWFNFIYGSLTGNDCETGPAVAHLREWPLDLVGWSFRNSHRADLRTPPGYQALKAGIRTFSPRETGPMRWDHWAMEADGGSGGRDVIEPSAWLLAYWMGRYHGFIGAPSEVERNTTKAHPLVVPTGGAKPYSGPARPERF